MLTMIDQLYDREYQAARPQMNGGLARSLGAAVKSIGDVFQVLNQIEYAAPWSERRAKGHCG